MLHGLNYLQEGLLPFSMALFLIYMLALFATQYMRFPVPFERALVTEKQSPLFSAETALSYPMPVNHTDDSKYDSHPATLCPHPARTSGGDRNDTATR